MAQLVEECKVRLPRLFESEEFERQKAGNLEQLKTMRAASAATVPPSA